MDSHCAASAREFVIVSGDNLIVLHVLCIEACGRVIQCISGHAVYEYFLVELVSERCVIRGESFD